MLVRRTKKYLFSLLVITMIFSMSIPSRGTAMETNLPTTSDLYQSIISKETQWINSLQFASGAIPTYSTPLDNYNGKYEVIPYFTHFGLLGLLENNDSESLATVKKYMDWYFSHMNREATATTPAGSVYDYYIDTDKQTETSTNDFDSTDSYASTFLNVLRKYAEVSGDNDYLIHHKDDIMLIANAMLSTQQSDGLTWAKPSYQVKYLMDNSEVYHGLNDLIWISSQVFHDDAAANQFKQHKDEVYNGIQSLWLDSKNAFAPNKMADVSSMDWKTFYPDATAQLFPIWTGVLDPKSDKAIQLYNTFNENHPGWPALKKDDAFPWAIVAYTASLMGDKVRVDQFLQSVKDTYIDQNHPWPWYVMESGLTLLTASKMMKIQDEPKVWNINNLPDQAVISQLPYEVNGTAQGVHEVTFNLTNHLTEETKSFHSTVSSDGAWSISLEGLLNGQYTVDIYAKDLFNNVLFEKHLSIEVKVGSEDEIIKSTNLQSDLNVLHRDESTELKITASYENGAPVDLEKAKVIYKTNLPDLVEINSKGILSLKGLPQNEDQLNVYAIVEQGNNAVKTNMVTITLSHQAVTLYDDVMDYLTTWLTSRQLDSGAITLNGQDNEINPLASNIGALGLLVRPETFPNAKKYIEWYIGNWNWGDQFGVYGTQYNEVKNPQSSEWQSTGTYDSSSANIGSFITLLRGYYEKTNTFEPSNYNLDIMTGGLGIMGSQDSDGLMWRYPNGSDKRLFDNVITYKGMADSVWLFDHYFQSSGQVSYFSSFANSLANGIETKLWDNEKGYYYQSISRDEQKQSPDFTSKIAASEQLVAIDTGFVAPNSDQAKTVYSLYNQHFPKWSTEGALSGADAPILYTAALMGDKKRVDAYLGRLITAIKQGNLPADLTVDQVGYFILAANLAKQLPTNITLEISNLKPNEEVSPVSVNVKGTATGANRVRITWHERFGTENGVEETEVSSKGLWSKTIKKLKRGSDYEVTVTAIDPLGYNIPYTEKSVRISVKE